MDTSLESIKREAYAKALKFKNTGMEEDVIYARLEKQGIPDHIAKEVARNVFMKMKQDRENQIPLHVNRFTVWKYLFNSIFK